MLTADNVKLIYQKENGASENCDKKLRIIHFNDVYNIEGTQEEPLGGAARFYTIVKELQKNHNHLLVFSGDAFSPSICKIEL